MIQFLPDPDPSLHASGTPPLSQSFYRIASIAIKNRVSALDAILYALFSSCDMCLATRFHRPFLLSLLLTLSPGGLYLRTLSHEKAKYTSRCMHLQCFLLLESVNRSVCCMVSYIAGILLKCHRRDSACRPEFMLFRALLHAFWHCASRKSIMLLGPYAENIHCTRQNKALAQVS